jgi:hypothetical protein
VSFGKKPVVAERSIVGQFPTTPFTQPSPLIYPIHWSLLILKRASELWAYGEAIQPPLLISRYMASLRLVKMGSILFFDLLPTAIT